MVNNKGSKVPQKKDEQKVFCQKEKYDPRNLTITESGRIQVTSPPEEEVRLENGEFIKNGKRYIRIVTKEYVRDLVVPEKEDTPKSLILCQSELDKIEIIQGEGKSIEEELKEKKEKYIKELAESETRKRELQKDLISFRTMGPTLTKLEYIAKEKANILLKKAKEVRQEDDDDIKLCNNLLLGTKCQAIRDAQIEEKKLIMEEWEKEEKRLEALMEQERLKQLAREKEEELMKLKKKNEYINDLNSQVQRNNLDREMEAEKQLEEAMILKEAVMQSKIDYLHQQEEKRMQQAKTREQINKMNQIVLDLIEEERQKAKLADLKIQELMKKKAFEEQQREEELLKEKREREKELAKMRMAQQKNSDDIEKREIDRARRVQQQYEEQWRKKERKEYEDKVRANEKLKEDRRLQIEEKQKAQAREIERELEEVARFQMLEQAMQQKEEEEWEQRKQAKEEYKAQLLKQMNEKEKERIAKRKMFFEQGNAEVQEMNLNKLSLKENMKRKVDSLRTHNIPEKYILDVERKLQTKTNSGYD